MWDVEPDVFTGVETILARARWSSTHLAFSSHRNANVLVTVDGDAATGIVDYAVDTRMTDGTWVCGTGTYTDDHARRNGQWAIVRRTAPFFERLPHSTVRG